MFAAKSLMRVGPQLKTILGSRHSSVIASKPMVRVSFAEKVAHAVVITVACTAVPTYVLLNIRKYRGLE